MNKRGRPTVVYMHMVRPAMLYAFETEALSKRQNVKLGVAEIKMLRFSL